MNRRRIQFGFLLLGGGALLLLAVWGEFGRTDELPDHTIETPYGKVEWNHELHARLPDFNCQSCHHRARPGTSDPQSCLDCHLRLDQCDADCVVVSHHEQMVDDSKEEVRKASPAMIAFHNKCIGCHDAVKKGPVGCRECHNLPDKTGHQDISKLTEADGPKTVLLSHLQDKYEPIEFDHAAHAEDYSDGCGDCHHHSSEVEATPACRACHATRSTADGSKVLGLEDAYHSQCIGCHKKNDSGPMDCGDCHEDHDPAEEFPEAQGPKISNLGQLSAIYESVEFNHEEHVDMTDSCDKCHHHSSEIEAVPACRECHNRPFTPKGSKKLGLVDAYHTQCIRCHIDEGGPESCDGCHAAKAQ